MRRESMERQAEKPARLFVHLRVGLRVRVSGCPEVIVSVTSMAWGCKLGIEVNGSIGEYHPADLYSIIEIVEEGIQDNEL